MNLYGLGAKLLAGALLVALLIGIGYRSGVKAEVRRMAPVLAKHAAVLADIAEATRASAEKARNVERQQAAMLNAIAASHQKDLLDAQALNDTTVAGLRAGTVVLQDHWRGQRCPNVPSPAGSTAFADAEANDRAESAGRIVQAAAECDAQVNGLQAVITADRQP